MNSLRLLCTLLVLYVVFTNGGLEVVSPSKLQRSYRTAPLKLPPSTFNVTGRLVWADPKGGCESIKNKQEINGNIVLTSFDEAWCAPSERAWTLQQLGAVGMLIKRADSEIGTYSDLEAAIEDGEIVIIHMTPTDENPYGEWGQGPGGITFRIVFASAALICIGLAAYNWRMFILMYGLQLSVAQSCLALEVITNLIRFLYMLEPLHYDDKIWPLAASTMLMTLSIPFAIATTLLIAFFWQEALHACSMSKVLTNLAKFKWPYVVIVGLAVIIEVLSTLIRARVIPIVIPGNTVQFDSIFYLLVTLAVCVFFFVTGYKITSILRKSTAVNNNTKRLRRITWLIVISGAGMLVTDITLLLFALTTIFKSSPAADMTAYVFILTGFYMTSFAQTLAFIPPKPSKDISLPETKGTSSGGSAHSGHSGHSGHSTSSS